MSKADFAKGPYTITSTVPETEYYKFEDDRTKVGKTSYCTSGFLDDNGKGDDNSALGVGYDMTKLYSEQRLEDYIRTEAKFLADYVTKNQYNLKVVKELLEGMLQEVNNRINWVSQVEEKLKNEK